MNQQAAASAPPTVSLHGKCVILGATAIALLATPLAAPAMPQIARMFADQASSEPFARAILAAISILPGEPSVSFLVKFILLSVPALFIVVSAPASGWFCDRFGRKLLLNLSLLVFAVGGTSGYFADSFLTLFIGRAILGLAIAGIKTASVAMVGDLFTGAERNRFIGWQGSALKIGGVIFMVLGGYLANVSWQAPFLGYLLAFLVLPSGLYAIAESLPEGAGHKHLKGEAPAVPFWPATWVFVSATLASGLFFITPVQLPFFVINNFGASPSDAGNAIAVGNTVGALIALTYHRFRGRLNFQAIYAFIFLFMGLGYFGLTLAPTYQMALPAMIVAGLGFGLYVPNHSAWILSVVGPSQRGFGVGLVTTAMFLGQFLAPIIVQPLIVAGHPAAVWQSISGLLFALAALYAGLAWLVARKPRAATV